MENKFCCTAMKQHATYECQRRYHKNRFKCPDCIIHYDKKISECGIIEWGIIVHDGSEGYIPINYCPWCGHKLNKKNIKEMSKVVSF